jgi:hypothetical protein
MSDKGFRKTIALTGFLLVMLSVVFAKGGGEVPAEGGDRIPDLPDNPIERLEQYFAAQNPLTFFLALSIYFVIYNKIYIRS